ncbi:MULTISPECIES: 30S ribosomal protein S6 [Thermaerobacter]|uniref:Small ribosomal subunit protein bS6 n=1 Tax=Thermaerobacter subterraneus DSM 13965 TaxID=867903 RepID=K6QDK7_9FIRM|nr:MULTISPECIES: 30S ribosomal protein S6 [Thermaerobacter]EKP94786.1 ribosomal protein S6 [Thermaerobacter subterraneus DSM 13965]QIA28105.1 30S ribosomal protein S6 [Thermaerobacter sp. PB12/4term]
MRAYELMYITRPDLDEEAEKALLDRLQKIITDGGGTVEQVDVWGRRRLAYEIAGYREGHYTVVQFQGPAGVTHELERVIRITDDIIRHIIVLREKVA